MRWVGLGFLTMAWVASHSLALARRTRRVSEVCAERQVNRSSDSGTAGYLSGSSLTSSSSSSFGRSPGDGLQATCWGLSATTGLEYYLVGVVGTELYLRHLLLVGSTQAPVVQICTT